MPGMTKEQVQTWVNDFLQATSGGGGGTPTDWKKLQELMSKRVEVFVSCLPVHAPPARA
jgi:hypothetical protein